LGVVLGLAGCVGACGGKVAIKAESGTSSGSTGSSMTMGAGGSSSSSTTTSGTGAAGPGKVVTAETDIGQYQSITVNFSGNAVVPLKVIDGPFFVTDVYGSSVQPLDIVQGTDCSVMQGHTQVLGTLFMSPPDQVHGIRLPVLVGQTLCAYPGGPQNPITVLGFRPY
jgi:hypothetical protein